MVVTHFLSRCQNEPFATGFTLESCSVFTLWFKTTLQNDFVVIIHFFYFLSLGVKKNLLPQVLHWNPVRSFIEKYSAKWPCCDNSCLVLSSLDVKLNLWAFCYRSYTGILFTLWLKTTLQNDFVVIILTFQVQMSKRTFCHRSYTGILFAPWFITTLQNNLVVIIHVLYLQV